uniref:Uncharacterized protein n=1 Tax=Pithovirus LCPAC404 TaxID=2506597 RepID=A0A481ZDA2_9VIRU|nr:MAG: hypothetical protein LCPAC404_01690 [Pithovirus LCPAC404]
MVDIVALSYNVTTERIVSILKRGSIRISREDVWNVDFAGVFMSLITEEQDEIPAVQGYPGNLIFSTALLKRRDYHVNEGDFYGHLTDRSYSPNNLHLIKNIDDTSEIVFHNEVSTEYLEAIILVWTKPKGKDYYELRKALEDAKLRYYIHMIKPIPDNKLPMNVTYNFDPELKEDDKYRPRFCDAYSDFDDMTTEMTIDIGIARKLAINCGVSRSTALTFDDSDDLRLYLWDQGFVTKYVKHPELLPDQVYEPPFR